MQNLAGEQSKSELELMIIQLYLPNLQFLAVQLQLPLLPSTILGEILSWSDFVCGKLTVSGHRKG